MSWSAYRATEYLSYPKIGVVEKIDYSRPVAQNMHFLYDRSKKKTIRLHDGNENKMLETQ